MEIWERKPPGTLWATPGLLRVSFTLHIISYSTRNEIYRSYSHPAVVDIYTALDKADRRIYRGLSPFRLCYRSPTVSHWTPFNPERQTDDFQRRLGGSSSRNGQDFILLAVTKLIKQDQVP